MSKNAANTARIADQKLAAEKKAQLTEQLAAARAKTAAEEKKQAQKIYNAKKAAQREWWRATFVCCLCKRKTAREHLMFDAETNEPLCRQHETNRQVVYPVYEPDGAPQGDSGCGIAEDALAAECADDLLADVAGFDC